MDLIAQLTRLAEVIEGVRVNGRGDYFIETWDQLLSP